MNPAPRAPGAASSAIELVPLDTLKVGLSPRHSPPRPAHVDALTEVVDQLPPIIVHQGSRTVIDGVHRLAAHRCAGRITIAVLWLDCTCDQAFEASVQANIAHGLPLTLAERRAAALVILKATPLRSDRSIAEVCGLSHTTIAKVRAGSHDLSTPTTSNVRIGRDGRRRVQPPPRTPRVRQHTLRPEDGHAGTTPSSNRPGMPHRRPPSALRDRALDATTETRAFLEWMDATRIADDDWSAVAPLIPLGRLYELADEAHRRADAWTRLAITLERRARGKPPG